MTRDGEKSESADPEDVAEGQPPVKPRSPRSAEGGQRSTNQGPEVTGGSDRSTKWAIDRLDEREKRFSFAASGGALLFGVIVYAVENNAHFHPQKGQLSPQTVLVVGRFRGPVHRIGVQQLQPLPGAALPGFGHLDPLPVVQNPARHRRQCPSGASRIESRPLAWVALPRQHVEAGDELENQEPVHQLEPSRGQQALHPETTPAARAEAIQARSQSHPGVGLILESRHSDGAGFSDPSRGLG
jgi:hypothetical protein